MSKKKILIIAACLVLVVAGILLYTQVISPNNKYNSAVQALKDGQYTEASIAFQELKGYKDSDKRLVELHANELYDTGDYAAVVDIYKDLPVEYQDHADDLTAMYADACAKRDAGQYDEAVGIFRSLGNYNDSETQIKVTTYQKASALEESGEYDAATAIFESLGTYSDSSDRITEATYKKAVALAAYGKHGDAIDIFSTIPDYKDSGVLIRKAEADRFYDNYDFASAYDIYATLDEQYQTHSADYAAMYREAEEKLANKQFDEASEQFRSLGAYSDSADRAVQCISAKAKDMAESGNYTEASAIYTSIGDAENSNEALYMYAGRLAEEKKYDDAIRVYEGLADYRDSSTLAIVMSADRLYDEGKIAAAYDIYATMDEQYQTHSADYAAMYKEAEEKLANKQFDEASEQFRSLGSYSDSADRAVNCISAKAKDKADSGNYTEASAIYASIGDTENANAALYRNGQKLLEDGDYTGALVVFSEITGYKDVDSLLANDENLVAARKIAPFRNVGGTVLFGQYPQTAEGTDITPIEWMVLDYDETNNCSLLLSRYGLDAQPYNTVYEYVTWEECTLRMWLNGTFLNKAFTTQEQTGIMTTNVDNSDRQGYSKWSTSGGNNTQDKVFLLSYAEANKYLDVTINNRSNIKSLVAPTAFTKRQGASTNNSNKTTDGEAAGWWWLRSPGGSKVKAADVNSGGSLDSSIIRYEDGCVRPAFWINLESDIF